MVPESRTSPNSAFFKYFCGEDPKDRARCGSDLPEMLRIELQAGFRATGGAPLPWHGDLTRVDLSVAPLVAFHRLGTWSAHTGDSRDPVAAGRNEKTQEMGEFMSERKPIFQEKREQLILLAVLAVTTVVVWIHSYFWGL